MAIVIQAIASGPGHYTGFVDFPAKGSLTGPSLTVAGWFVLPHSLGDVGVKILLRSLGNKCVAEAAIGPRTDVQADVSLGEGMTVYGYEARVHGYDLPSNFHLDISVSFVEGGEARNALLASVTGSNEGVERESILSPIYVVGLARSGTTVLTRMIGAHPAVVCGDKYPLELCISTFYARMARLAASTADFSGYSKWDLFADNELVGPNPFASLNHVDRNVLDNILRTSSEIYSQAAADASDAWYNTIASADVHKRALFFVEKSQPGKGLITALNVYPRARCIVLVRDPRDGFLSRIRFNRKRGTKDFGEQSSRDFADWAALHVREHQAFLVEHQALRDRVVQVVRYEDLMEDPRRALTNLCTTLAIDPSGNLIDRMIEVGQDQSGHFGAHRTSAENGDDGLRDELRPLLGMIATELTGYFRTYGYSE